MAAVVGVFVSKEDGGGMAFKEGEGGMVETKENAILSFCYILD